MAELPRSRLLQLIKKQCDIFAATFNPLRLRLGNKILRQRLRGPALAAYYPRKSVSFRDLEDRFKPLHMETINEDEEDRLDIIKMLKARNKGAPKKKTSAAESRKNQRRR